MTGNFEHGWLISIPPGAVLADAAKQWVANQFFYERFVQR